MLKVEKKGMSQSPYCCINCSMTPSHQDGTYKDSILCEEVDVNWGDSVYICWDCAELIADLVGRATRGGFDDMKEELKELTAEHRQLLE